jgi:uncharacterized protein YjbI with pentapeptide repeats
MQGLTFNQNSIDSIDWEEDCYKECDFIALSLEGGHITADFNACLFTNIDWYMGLFNIVNFVSCKFHNCTFRGTSFVVCKFVECSFEDCSFIKDNMDSDCIFDESIAYSCTFNSTKGFNAVVKNA